MRFNELPTGQHFRFFATGSLLVKEGPRAYGAPQWGQSGNYVHDTDQEVIPVEPETLAPDERGKKKDRL